MVELLLLTNSNLKSNLRLNFSLSMLKNSKIYLLLQQNSSRIKAQQSKLHSLIKSPGSRVASRDRSPKPQLTTTMIQLQDNKWQAYIDIEYISIIYILYILYIPFVLKVFQSKFFVSPVESKIKKSSSGVKGRSCGKCLCKQMLLTSAPQR